MLTSGAFFWELGRNKEKIEKNKKRYRDKRNRYLLGRR